MTKIKIIPVYLLTLLLASLNAFALDEPLAPHEAFKFNAIVEGNTIKATWTAADDYYMYRDKIRFESGTPGIELGAPVYPKGKMKHGIKPDGTEGEVETYTKSVTLEVPVTKGSGELELIAFGQGCAEKLGICYPPQKRKQTLTVASATSAVNALGDLGSQLGLGIANDVNEPLDPEKAFAFSATVEGNTLRATWTIARDYYMYKDKFRFESTNPNIRFAAIKIPPGKMKHGITPEGKEGEVETYVDHVVIEVPFSVTKEGIKTLELVAHGQGCAELLGICYPPQKRAYSLNLVNAVAVAPMTMPRSDAVQTTTKDDFVSDQDKSAVILASGDTLKIILYFFLGGLALAFTACMYPMIPILSSIIVGQGHKVTTAHAFNLSLIYVSSMAITFGIMGSLFAGLAKGVNIQAIFQQDYVLIPFSLIFVALAFSMFGFFTIQLPASWQGKLSEISNHQKSGSYLGVIVMGALSALIIGPCAGPVLIGALIYVAKEGDVLLGFLSMFILGMGLGMPLLFIGLSHGKYLPKAGGWMDTVKYAAGAILLSVSLIFLERVSFISSMVIMLLWSAFFIIVGIYIGALDPIKEGRSGWFKLWKGLGLVFIVYGAIVMLGGLTGARNVNDPLHGSKLVTGSSHTQTELKFKRIKTVEDLQSELELASATNKYVLLDFYADWCAYCKTFEDYVLTDPNVKTLLSDFILLQVDVTKNDDKDVRLLKHTDVVAPPTFMFYGPDGKEKRTYRIVGEMNTTKFIERVNLVLKN